MQDSDTPVKIPLPFAASAGAPYINSIPTASQIGVTNGAASFTDGFPPLTFVPIHSGGAGPFGKDMNGLLHQITGGVQWLQAGGPIFYDAAFVGDIGGYPKGAIVASASTLGAFWQSTVDNNSSNPDTGGANWNGMYLPRQVTTATTFYTNFTTGSDSTGDGSSGNPWKTAQFAWSTLFNTLNGNGHTITLDVTGPDTGGLSVTGAIAGVETLNVVLHGTLGGTGASAGLIVSSAGRVDLTGTAGTLTGTTWCIAAANGGLVRFSGVTLGACGQAKISAGNSALVVIEGSYTDSAAGAISHIEAVSGYVKMSAAATVTQNGAAYTQFLLAQENGEARLDLAAFDGTPSAGPQYYVSTGGGAYLNGVTLPGSAGSADAGTYGWVLA